MRTILVAVGLMAAAGCGKKQDEATSVEPKAERPAAPTTGSAPAPQPTGGAIAGQKYKMNVRLGEQTAPPTLAPKDAVAPTAEAERQAVADREANEAAKREANEREAAAKAAAAKAAAEKAAHEAARPR